LAAETGADDYGMRRYVMALLKAGPNRDQDSTEAAQLQRAHLDNIKRMAEEGKLVMAGPFFDDWEVKGIYIFAVDTIEEAEELTKSDPAIRAGRLIMELHPWYGSAGLMKIGELHKKLAKKSI
ncbi:MAG: YciI family protein, partial [Ekhidna sp.]